MNFFEHSRLGTATVEAIPTLSPDGTVLYKIQ